METSPRPSMLGGRYSSRSQCGWRSWSSAASSMVTIRSSAGSQEESTLRVVVLPAPAPPATRMFSRPETARARNLAALADMVPKVIRSSAWKGSGANFRTVR